MAVLTSVILLLLSMSANGQTITSLMIQTANVDNAGMTTGEVDLQIINQEYAICEILDMSQGGFSGDFEQGGIDRFELDQLQECLNFPVPNKFIGLVRLSHHGIDAWMPDWIHIYFDDHTYATCIDGQWLDGGDKHDLNCTSPVKIN